MGKKVKKKAGRRVKMETRTGFVGVDAGGFAWVASTFASERNLCLVKCRNPTADIRPVLVIEDTPANRKRLGVASKKGSGK